METLGPWWPEDRLADVTHDPHTASWMRESGSITQRLRQQHPGLVVQVLHDGLATPLAAERLRLGLEAGDACWVREVRLHDRGQGLVHARTVVPQWGPGNPWHALQHLGRQPLGELLFGLPDLARSPLEWAQTQATASGPVRPTRRRVYTRQGAALLLTEAFEGLG